MGETIEGKESLWREYSLFGQGIECRIREDFRPDFLHLHSDEDVDDDDREMQPQLKRFKNPTEFATADFGNLLLGDEGLRVYEQVRVAKHPLQRALLAAAGNVVRIMSSYHLHEVALHVQ